MKLKPTDDCIQETWKFYPYKEVKVLFKYYMDDLSVLEPKYKCANCLHQYAHKLTNACNMHYEHINK